MHILTQPATLPRLMLFTLFMLSGLSACSQLTKIEQPTIQIRTIHLLPGDTLLPTLVIVLQVSNPNSVPLPLRSFNYELSLNSHRIFTGVADQLPTIDAHSSVNVTLRTKPDVTGAVELLHQLMGEPRGYLEYKLSGELDPGLLLPTLQLEHAGELPIND